MLAAAFAIGALTQWIRFRTAQLPAFRATSDLGIWRLLLDGLLWLVVMVAAFAIISLLAYWLAARRWGERRTEWHRLVVEHGVRAARDPRRDRDDTRTAPLGENAVRILAGFNLAVLCGVVTAIVVTTVDRILTSSPWVLVPLGLVVFGGIYTLLTNWGPLKVGHRTHAAIWVLVALVAAVVTTLPLGLLILVGVAISTLGRVVARTALPRTPSGFLRSPLPWSLIAIYTVVGAAYYAVPPVAFERDQLSTTSGERVDGYLAQSGSGTYVVTCEALADATAFNPRLAFVPSSAVLRARLGGPMYYLDSGDRPSLASLAERLLGVSISLPLPVGTGFEPTEPTCAGTGPATLSHGFEDPVLGAAVIAGPAPPAGRAVDGDQPIEQTTPAIAHVAREFQPILEVLVADENWPISVGALLADRGPGGAVPCLARETDSVSHLPGDAEASVAIARRLGRLSRVPNAPGQVFVSVAAQRRATGGARAV